MKRKIDVSELPVSLEKLRSNLLGKLVLLGDRLNRDEFVAKSAAIRNN
jgi:hypothetical protein